MATTTTKASSSSSSVWASASNGTGVNKPSQDLLNTSADKGVIKGTPSTTPSTSQNDLDSSSLLDISSASIRNSDEPSKTLSAAKLEAQFLWKQSSKRRLFGGINYTQKRFFVVTPNELAYKEKENDEQEFKVVWKIPSEVLSVDQPEVNAKEFGVLVLENGIRRVVKLSASDNLTAMKFAKAIDAAIKSAKVQTPEPTPGQTSAVATSAVGGADEAEKAAGGEKTTDDLAITNGPGASTDSSVAGDDASQGSTEDVVSNAERTEVTTDEAVAATNDDLVSIPTAEEPKSPQSKSGSMWFWGNCCSAE